jgi:betaine-aldehyde dehydrogenase
MRSHPALVDLHDRLGGTHRMTQIFVGGSWVEATGAPTREIRCPADGSLVRQVADAAHEHAVAAILAAREAFDSGPWPGTPERERGALLSRVADLLVRDKARYARAEALDTGKRLVEADYDMDDVVASIRYFAGIAGTEAGRVVDSGNPGAISRIVYSPVGVCALITPWNYPLLQTSWKVAPALLAGNTFVLKPSELTPSTAGLLMEALEEVGRSGQPGARRRAGHRGPADPGPARGHGELHGRGGQWPSGHGRGG